MGKGESRALSTLALFSFCLFTFGAPVLYHAPLCWTSFQPALATRPSHFGIKAFQSRQVRGKAQPVVGFTFIFRKDNFIAHY